MADFLTRLAERTLGVTPVVRPLIPPRFAPETAPYPLDLGWEVDALPLDEREAPRTREAPTRYNPAARRTRGTASDRREYRSVAPPAPAPRLDEAPQPPEAPHSPDEAPPPDSLPDPHPENIPDAAPPRPAAERDDADRPPAEKRGAPKENGTRSEPSEEEQTAPETTAERSGEPVEIRSSEEEEPFPVSGGVPTVRRGRPRATPPETRHPRGADHERDEGVAPAPSRGTTRGSPVAPPESAPARGASYPGDPAVDPGERVRLLPRVVPERGEIPEPQASQLPPAAPEPYRAVRGTVGGAADARPRRGLPGPPPPEVPSITVSIGRVEVRAVPPAPEPPRRQAAPPVGLSLDDYLRSRDGERR